jgi:hypothetical protein
MVYSRFRRPRLSIENEENVDKSHARCPGDLGGWISQGPILAPLWAKKNQLTSLEVEVLDKFFLDDSTLFLFCTEKVEGSL